MSHFCSNMHCNHSLCIGHKLSFFSTFSPLLNCLERMHQKVIRCTKWLRFLSGCQSLVSKWCICKIHRCSNFAVFLLSEKNPITSALFSTLFLFFNFSRITQCNGLFHKLNYTSSMQNDSHYYERTHYELEGYEIEGSVL